MILTHSRLNRASSGMVRISMLTLSVVSLNVQVNPKHLSIVMGKMLPQLMRIKPHV